MCSSPNSPERCRWEVLAGTVKNSTGAPWAIGRICSIRTFIVHIHGNFPKNSGMNCLLSITMVVCSFLPGSMLNHICDLNCFLEGMASRAISPGEELTVSYCPHDLSPDTRRKLLPRNYGFKCACDVFSKASLTKKKKTLPLLDSWQGRTTAKFRVCCNSKYMHVTNSTKPP